MEQLFEGQRQMVNPQDGAKPAISGFKRGFKWGASLAGVALLLFVGYFYYSLTTGKERVTAVCRQITPGMTIEQLTELASRHGLGPGKPRAGVPFMYLAERRSHGRHACRVDFENSVVKSAAYNYAD